MHEVAQYEAERFEELWADAVASDRPDRWQGKPYRLNSGRWGTWIQHPTGQGPKVGDTVTVTTRRGKRWDATITGIVDRSMAGELAASVVTTAR